jgi:hypothetical protein
MATELDDGDLYDEDDAFCAADVFVFGMILWEVATGRRAFADCRHALHVRTRIHAGRMPRMPSGITEKMKNLIEGCWDLSPEARPRFADIVDAPELLLFADADVCEYVDFV